MGRFSQDRHLSTKVGNQEREGQRRSGGMEYLHVHRAYDVLAREPGSELRRDEGRRLFGLDPIGYRAGRPDYPDAVYETLVERCGLGAATRVLEIGPGTGLVTQRLLGAGAHVTAIEPDPSMASFLRNSTASAELDVVTSSFEDAEVARAGFDLGVAATSFHWVDQEVGLSKLGQALKPGGWVALWWTLFRDPSQLDEFSQAVEQVLGPATRGAFDEPGRPPFQLDEAHRRRDLTRWAGLDDVTSEIITWTHELTPAQVRALYASMATVIRRPPDEQVRILNEVERIATQTSDGLIRRRFVTALYTGRRH
jgi:SAM-dependent methyltransferase